MSKLGNKFLISKNDALDRSHIKKKKERAEENRGYNDCELVVETKTDSVSIRWRRGK